VLLQACATFFNGGPHSIFGKLTRVHQFLLDETLIILLKNWLSGHPTDMEYMMYFPLFKCTNHMSATGLFGTNYA